MRHLIIAHHQEPLDWLTRLDGLTHSWEVIVITNGDTRPNTGREAAAYLWWILRCFGAIRDDDLYAFVQADPFPHAPNLLRFLDGPVADFESWRSLGEHVYDSDGDGGPHHPGLPVAATYEALTGRPWPGAVTFHAGGQWAAPGRVLLDRSRGFYERLLDTANNEAAGGPWVLERVWHLLFRDER